MPIFRHKKKNLLPYKKDNNRRLGTKTSTQPKQIQQHIQNFKLFYIRKRHGKIRSVCATILAHLGQAIARGRSKGR